MFKSGGIYFAVVFGVGFLLGILRSLFLVPMVGTRYAELCEAPLMLTAIFFAAQWIRHRFCQGFSSGKLLGVGCFAVALVLAADIGVGVGIWGMSPLQVILDRDTISGLVYYGLLLVFALMPWWLGRSER